MNNLNAVRGTITGNRWWIYQRERFPLLVHGTLIVAFGSSAVCVSALLRGETVFPAISGWAVALLCSFAFFAHLRIADEFKDYADDLAHRPYRPVPRGLVRLSELRGIAVGLAVAQIVAAVTISWTLLVLLVVVWGYFALMSREFFIGEWLKAHPFTYLWTHMLIMPLIDLFATACDWAVAGNGWPPGGLVWFLLASFFNGVVIEVGRKIRGPDAEEEGVETYSVLWGRSRAIAVWLSAVALTLGCALLTARAIGFALPVAVTLGALLAIAVVLGARFARRPSVRGGEAIEKIAGVWTLVMYLSVGLVPMALTVAGWR